MRPNASRRTFGCLGRRPPTRFQTRRPSEPPGRALRGPRCARKSRPCACARRRQKSVPKRVHRKRRPGAVHRVSPHPIAQRVLPRVCCNPRFFWAGAFARSPKTKHVSESRCRITTARSAARHSADRARHARYAIKPADRNSSWGSVLPRPHRTSAAAGIVLRFSASTRLGPPLYPVACSPQAWASATHFHAARSVARPGIRPPSMEKSGCETAPAGVSRRGHPAQPAARLVNRRSQSERAITIPSSSADTPWINWQITACSSFCRADAALSFPPHARFRDISAVRCNKPDRAGRQWGGGGPQAELATMMPADRRAFIGSLRLALYCAVCTIGALLIQKRRRHAYPHRLRASFEFPQTTP